jgi:thiamine biosynthesis lipoprotein
LSRPERAAGPGRIALFLLVTVLAAVAVRIVLHSGNQVEVNRRTPVLGTFATYIVIADSREAEAILGSMDSLARHLDGELGFYGTGELNRINCSGGASLSGMSWDMRNLLDISFAVAEETDSLFDPSIGALVRTWGFPDTPHLPDSQSVDSALAESRLENLALLEDSLILGTGMKLDFGAVAKGYTCDRIFHLAMDRGATAALVEIGGEIRCGGTPESDRVWRLAVRDPRGQGIMEMLRMKSGALATSGDYESYFMSGGLRYCHILDPRTGYPERGIASVTVASDSAAICDALATAISVGGIPLAESLPDSLFDLIIVVSEKENGEMDVWRRGEI